jgi:hypothetical protein
MSTNDGTVQMVPAEAQVVKMEQFNQEARYAVASRQHLWIAVQTHVVSKDHLKTNGADGTVLDNESLRQVMLGCYICGSPYDPILLERKCKGEPR